MLAENDRTPLSPRDGRPEVHIDVPAVVGQFLIDLSLSDLVIELIQNDLDAGSPCTTITFGENALICDGRGKPIDRSGWKRLRQVLGAGGDVKAKIDGIGSKNHGLRSAFLIGDTIILQSAGKRIDLTVRGALPESARFYPAGWPEERDVSAPRCGTRITVPYRTEPITVPNSEETRFDAPRSDNVAALLAQAVAESPASLIAASAPARKWHYELTLACPTSSLTFIFDCEPLYGRFQGLYRRTCRVKEFGRPTRVVLRHVGSPFELSFGPDDRGNLPRLFRRKDNVVGEIIWCVDRNDLPIPACGALRYPIAYPIEYVKSGYGFDISGPFISGRARHSLSDDLRNTVIRDAGRTAFARLMRDKLIPLFGAASTCLISSSRFPDPDAEDQLVAELLNRRAFPVVKTSKAGNDFDTVTMAESTLVPAITVASPTYNRKKIADKLVRLAQSSADIIHSAVPERVIESLFRIKDHGDRRIAWFNERDAARHVLIETAPGKGEIATPHWIDSAGLAVVMLDIARHHAPLPPDFVRQLKNDAVLPTQSGRAAAWALVRRSAKPVPEIPGIVSPSILHDRLSKMGVLKEGPLKIPPFALDEFVSNKDFSKVSPEGRERFFEWLRTSHSLLRPQALRAIAAYPIWRSANGEYFPLSTYCWPPSARLCAFVHAVKPTPATDVVHFPGLRRGSKGALRLRTRPETAELRDWYLSRAEHIRDLKNAGELSEATRAIVELEEDLDWLRLIGGYQVTDIANGHESFSRSGEIKPIQLLHVWTKLVKHCGLLESDIADGASTRLYALLGSPQQPTGPALVRALNSDLDQSLLFNRLEAYKALGRDLKEFSTELIMMVGGRAIAPGTLTFPSTTNWWGSWKIPLETTPDVPRFVTLLEEAGVVHQALTEPLSRAFFEWLSQQGKECQKSHLPQIIRHWAQRRYGPSRWCTRYPSLPCIPVVGRNNVFDLISWNKVSAARSLVFLPDFRDLQDKLVANNGSVRLVIISAKGVSDSVIEIMREVGLPSLRDKVGQPIRIHTFGALERNEELDHALAMAQSVESSRWLTQRLPEYRVPVSALRRGWQQRLASLKGVRMASRLDAVFYMLKSEYRVKVASGIDERTQFVCIEKQCDYKLAFYDALASHLFDEGVSPLYAYGLLLALESRERPMQFDLGTEDTARGETGPAEIHREPPRRAHGLNSRNLKPVVPAPAPLGNITDITRHADRKYNPAHAERRKSSTYEMRNSIEEEEQKLQLKEKHYGWHCQACIGEYEVINVAPPWSYVYAPMIRRKLVEAHHVEHLQNRGTVGAQNLLVLCSFHHDLLGDQLSATIVIQALSKAKPVVRSFPVNADGTIFSNQSGLMAGLQMHSAPFNVSLFFTEQHAKTWLNAHVKACLP